MLIDSNLALIHATIYHHLFVDVPAYLQENFLKKAIQSQRCAVFKRSSEFFLIFEAPLGFEHRNGS